MCAAPNTVVKELQTDISEHFDEESAHEDDAELSYQHYTLDDEYEVVIGKSLEKEITVPCQHFVVVQTEYPISELLSAVAEERFDGNVPDRTTDCKVHMSNESGDIGTTVETWRDTDMDVDEAAEQFSSQYE